MLAHLLLYLCSDLLADKTRVLTTPVSQKILFQRGIGSRSISSPTIEPFTDDIVSGTALSSRSYEASYAIIASTGTVLFRPSHGTINHQ